MLVFEFVESVCVYVCVCVKLVEASAKGFQVESVAVDAREFCLGGWLGCSLRLSADYQKGLEK